MLEWLIYLLLGAVAGLLSGMFGVGGGIVVVPMLAIVFTADHFPASHLMHLAIGTSLATIIINSMSSTWSHHQRQNIDWDILKSTTLGTLVGVIAGVWLASQLHSDALKLFFAIFECMVAIQLFLKSKHPESNLTPSVLNTPASFSFGGIVGLLSSLLGIGGGTVSLPILLLLRVKTRKAIGTAAAMGLPISVVGTVAYSIAGRNIEHLPTNSLGYIYIPAFIGIALTGLMTAPLGVSLAQKLPIGALKKLLATLLFGLGIKMLLSLYL